MIINNIKVSVCCLAYNHEKYIRKTLDGFVMQKTNFPFEVIVHDDASTDRTAEIIREYEKKYPEIIKPIYQTENQYSQGIKIRSSFFFPLVRGKYVALCEGDDYWTDINKLQIQYDYMESNPDCSLCVHQSEMHIISTNEIKYVNAETTDRDFSIDEIIMGGGSLFATCSYFMRQDVFFTYPDEFMQFSFGDYQIMLIAAILGSVHYLSRQMSVYNSGVEGSWSDRNNNGYYRILCNNQEIELLKIFDNYTLHMHNRTINERIQEKEYINLILRGDFFTLKKCFKNYYIVDKKKYGTIRILKGCINAKIKKFKYRLKGIRY